MEVPEQLCHPESQSKPSANGPLVDLIAPRRGPTTAIPPASPPAEPTTQQPQPMIQSDDNEVVADAEDPRYWTLHHYHHNRCPLKRYRPATHARHAADESSPILLVMTKV